MSDIYRYRKYAGNKFRALDEKFIVAFDENDMLDMVKTTKYYSPGIPMLLMPPKLMKN